MVNEDANNRSGSLVFVLEHKCNPRVKNKIHFKSLLLDHIFKISDRHNDNPIPFTIERIATQTKIFSNIHGNGAKYCFLFSVLSKILF